MTNDEERLSAAHAIGARIAMFMDEDGCSPPLQVQTWTRIHAAIQCGLQEAFDAGVNAR